MKVDLYRCMVLLGRFLFFGLREIFPFPEAMVACRGAETMTDSHCVFVMNYVALTHDLKEKA